MKEYQTITRCKLMPDYELNNMAQEGWNLDFFHSEIMNGHTYNYIYIFSKYE